MYVSMNPKGETGKVIHISQNDTNREVEFIPYDQNGLVKTTSDETVAHINSIKGNTVRFNQLVQNGNFADTSNWGATRGTLSTSENILTFTITEVSVSTTGNRIVQASNLKINHKYCVLFDVLSAHSRPMYLASGGGTNQKATDNSSVANTWTRLHALWTRTDATYSDFWIGFNCDNTFSVGETIKLKNVQIFDLTLMGIDNLTTVAEVEAWLSSHIGDLPYFDYTQGTLIPFTGTGLKTENTDQTESNTLSLPTLTYFPSGMKSADTFYDEWNETKAITRLTEIVFDGSNDEGWAYNTQYGSGVYLYNVPTDSLLPSLTSDNDTTIYLSSNYVVSIWKDRQINIGSSVLLGTNKRIFIKTPITTLEALKTELASKPLQIHIALATPTETDISLDLSYPIWNGGTEQILPVNTSTPTTSPIKANITYPDRTEDTEFLYKQTSFVFIPRTWAFVCKNITQALTLVGNVLKGTIPGTMTSESGKFPLKLKMTDEDGDVFSEKIDLFVERKP